MSEDWFARAVDAVVAGKGLASVLEEPEPPRARPAAPSRAILYLSGGRAVSFALDALRGPGPGVSWEQRRRFERQMRAPPEAAPPICRACGQVVWPDGLGEGAASPEAQKLDAQRVADAAVALKIASGEIVSEHDVRHCSPDFLRALMGGGVGLATKRELAHKSLTKIARAHGRTRLKSKGA